MTGDIYCKICKRIIDEDERCWWLMGGTGGYPLAICEDCKKNKQKQVDMLLKKLAKSKETKN